MHTFYRSIFTVQNGELREDPHLRTITIMTLEANEEHT